MLRRCRLQFLHLLSQGLFLLEVLTFLFRSLLAFSSSLLRERRELLSVVELLTATETSSCRSS
eukprot:m.326191 g.326191  ORF g.326191 m.326191 type:complete len:63 (+) comp55569_c0_seq23:617-805(+)